MINWKNKIKMIRMEGIIPVESVEGDEFY